MSTPINKNLVSLVAVTKPSRPDLMHLSLEEFIVYVARVSNPSNQLNTATAPKLLRYCIEHAHWSIFEHAFLTFEINTTRAIAAQILRHRSFTFQEFCVDGDTYISLWSTANARKVRYKIKNLYFNQQVLDNHLAYSYDTVNECFDYFPISDIFYNGKKPCYKITLRDGKSIVCTKEHKFFTESGRFETIESILFLKIDENNEVIDFAKNQRVGVNGVRVKNRFSKPIQDRHSVSNLNFMDYITKPNFVEVESIKYVGERDVYDLEIDHQSHNYVANGIVTHNSQRYAKVLEVDTNIEARLQDHKNRQNSLEVQDQEVLEWFYEAQKEVADLSLKKYQEALDKGIAKEQARFLLPLSTKTTIYMTGNLRSWLHYIALRGDKATQKEHRQIALSIQEILKEICPNIMKAFLKTENDETVSST